MLIVGDILDYLRSSKAKMDGNIPSRNEFS